MIFEVVNNGGLVAELGGSLYFSQPFSICRELRKIPLWCCRRRGLSLFLSRDRGEGRAHFARDGSGTHRTAAARHFPGARERERES